MSGLTARVLNRTLLERQYLLERGSESVPQLCERLVGLQAQDVMPPYIGLWSRMSDFDPGQVSSGLLDRSLVRITLMRGTIHLVTAGDALRIAPHIQPELEKVPFRKGFNFGATVGLDPAEVREQGERAFGDEPVPAADLRARAAVAYPDRNPSAVVQAWLCQLQVLQTPPRGLWRDNSRPVWSRIEPWLGAAPKNGYPLSELIIRYLRAFGPATAADVSAWSELVGIAPVLTGMGDRVRSYTDDRGRTLYDAADAELADPDRPAPARLLGWYDNVYLAHRDRGRIVPGGGKPMLRRAAQQVAPVLLDGFIAGTYAVSTQGGSARLQVFPDRAWTAAERDEVEAEAAALLGFLLPECERRVEIFSPGADSAV